MGIDSTAEYRNSVFPLHLVVGSGVTRWERFCEMELRRGL